MAQVQIVSKPEGFFREYRVEAGDTVPGISFRFGQVDWRSVYAHSVNAAFRAQFPDPLQLVAGSPVSLYVPLAGRDAIGVSVNGAPLSGYLAAHLVDRLGNPLANVPLRLIEPGVPLSQSKEVITSPTGDVFIPNPKAGDHSLVTPDYELKMLADVATVPVIGEASSLYLQDSRPTTPFLLTPNIVNQIAAVRIFYVICPMCAVTFRLRADPAATIVCPNDGFDLTKTEEALRTEPYTFLSPIQIPATTEHLVTANGLTCRSHEVCDSLFGRVLIFWDESRFADPLGDDYQLWAIKDGAVVRQDVIGRNTWGAKPPILETGRNYLFHDRAATPGTPYAGRSIPDSQTNQLSTVFRWITVHHTASSSKKPIKQIQEEHQTDPDPEKRRADIAYHFFITPQGNVFEARALAIAGSHVPTFNPGNVGIVLAGDFDTPGGDERKEAAVSALFNLVKVLAARFGIKSVWGHRHRDKQIPENARTGTVCPGERLLEDVKTLRKAYPEEP